MRINPLSMFIAAITPAKTKYAVISGVSAVISAVAARYFVNAEKNATIRLMQDRIVELEANQRPPNPFIIGKGNAKGLRPSRR